MTERDLNADLAAVLSPEYQAALAAQIDYDSTSEGQGILDNALKEATDPDQIKHLIARKLAGKYSGVARSEQVAFMPPVEQRNSPRYKPYNSLAKARERIAREYGCAAAEANAWSKVSPPTISTVFELFDEVLGYEKELGLPTILWRHPHLFAKSTERAPWLGSPFTRKVDVGDVIKLTALGMEAVFRSGRVFATGNPDGAFRWGYDAAMDGQVTVFTSAPDLRAWDRERKKNGVVS